MVVEDEALSAEQPIGLHRLDQLTDAVVAVVKGRNADREVNLRSAGFKPSFPIADLFVV